MSNNSTTHSTAATFVVKPAECASRNVMKPSQYVSTAYGPTLYVQGTSNRSRCRRATLSIPLQHSTEGSTHIVSRPVCNVPHNTQCERNQKICTGSEVSLPLDTGLQHR